MYYLPVQQDCVKFGICVGKTLGNAVVRNKMKRQIREVLRKIDFLQKGFHIVLVARRNLQNRDFSDIDKNINDILSILKKACPI